ncbi:MAG: MFS transporter [Chloroflexi bacterium]|nr:MFS transporter [Chloroflexota bacterium]
MTQSNSGPSAPRDAPADSASPSSIPQPDTAASGTVPPRDASGRTAGVRRTPGGRGNWRHTFSSLSNRNYRILWLAMLLLMGAMQMQMIARGYLTYDLTESPAILGIVSAGFALPMLLLALFGGAFADRLERRRIVQLGQVGAGLIALFVAVSITTESVTWYHLLAASMMQGAVFSFFMPARQAMIPQLVGQGQLTNAMALDAMGMSATTLLAPAVAGFLYNAIQPDGVYYVVTAMCAGAVFLTVLLPRLPESTGTGRSGVLSDIGAGLSYIRSSSLVMALLIIGLTSTVLAMPFRFLMPIFIVDIYHLGPEAMGLMTSMMGLGTLGGSLFIAALGNWQRGRLLILSSFISGAALLLVALLPFYAVALALMVLLGLGDAGRRTLNQSLLMEVTDDQYRARVMSLFMINFALIPLGVLPAGLAAEFLGGQMSVGILAGLLIALTAIILATQRGLRNLR